ncbi:uncharacterized protein CDAR_234871 [Caerostris darwini]|uniref:L antigen family member 3 n=1 Tax=Caerostris darwini TaxID=1538125 RepID=A0AAV4SX26_9ARAC|nr:uncharacterized protein CDAR_234871 [Caerostris darwini]
MLSTEKVRNDDSTQKSDAITISVESDGIATLTLEVCFYCENDATIAYNSLRIDKEPPRGNVKKELSVKENNLIVKFSSKDIKKIKSSAGSFMDYAKLVANTIRRFGRTDNDEKTLSIAKELLDELVAKCASSAQILQENMQID